MQFIYEGVDITPHVGVTAANTVEFAGGSLDSVEVICADNSGLWSEWQPRIGDKIQLLAEGYSSGVHYIDQLGQQQGLYVLRALSAPPGCKTKSSKSWEQVSFLQLAADTAAQLGFGIKTYGVSNFTYSRVDRASESSLAFLSERAALEGYSVKLFDNNLIIFGEKYMESRESVAVLNFSDFWDDAEYTRRTENTYSKCIVGYGNISGTFSDLSKALQTLAVNNVYVTNISEAQRFAKGILRGANKNEHVVSGNIKLNVKIAAGNTVNLSGQGTADGKYFIDKLEHDFIAQKTAVKMHRVLEEY